MLTEKQIIDSMERIFDNTKRIHGKSESIDWVKVAIHKSAEYLALQGEEKESTNIIQIRDLTDEEWLKLPKEEILQLYKNCYQMLQNYIGLSGEKIPEAQTFTSTGQGEERRLTDGVGCLTCKWFKIGYGNCEWCLHKSPRTTFEPGLKDNYKPKFTTLTDVDLREIDDSIIK